MKSLNQIYSLVLESIIDESAKDDAINKFKRHSTEEVVYYVNKFWDEIRAKETDPKLKDINHWLKGQFANFKDYIDNFKSEKDKKRDAQSVTTVDNGKGKLLKIVDGYELWKVESYKAAKYLGRDYKNEPSKWCISSDTEEHWFDYYINQDKRFIFLINSIQHDKKSDVHKWDKIAISITDDKPPTYWDLLDNRTQLNDLPENVQNIIEKIKDETKWYDINLTDEYKKLINATEKGTLLDVEHIVLPMQNIPKSWINNALIVACERGNFPIVKFLIAQGANANADPDNNLVTPLMGAITAENIQIVKYLFDHGADINAEQYAQPIDMAIEQGNKDIVEYLVKCGLNIPNRNGALRTAVKYNDIEMAKYLIANDAEIIAVSDEDMKYSNEETKKFVHKLQDEDETHI